ncbi:unnamed protein product, partial [marine sediment metagenome]
LLLHHRLNLELSRGWRHCCGYVAANKRVPVIPGKPHGDVTVGKNDFISGKTVLIGSGGALYEDKGAASFDNTDGAITVESPFSAQIKAGTIFRILNAGAGQVAELLDSLVSYRGTTTADGAAGGGTLVCSDLTTKPDFDGNQAVIKSGPYAGQVRDIDGVTTGGTVTPHTSFSGTITTGTRFSITAIRTVPAELAALEALVTKLQGLCYYGVVTDVPFANTFTIPTLAGLGVDKFIDLSAVTPYSAFVFRDAAGGGAAPQGEYQPITAYDTGAGNFTTNAFTVLVGVGDEILIIHPFLAKIMNFAGLPPHVGSLAGNWQSGVATSGETGADLVSIGAVLTKYKLHSLLLNISALTLGATITVKLFITSPGKCRPLLYRARSRNMAAQNNTYIGGISITAGRF